MLAMFFSGFLAGLGGASEILGVQFRLIQGFSPGFGFEGLAIAFLANLEPLPILLVAIFFGTLQNAVTQLQQALEVPGAVATIMVGLPIMFLAAARGLQLLRGKATGGV